MDGSWHPTEDELILQYYGESAAADRTRIEAHLRACAACRSAWRDLSQTMVLVDEADVPEPGEDFERVMWTRISQALPPRPAVRVSRPLIVLGALAAVLVALVTAGYSWRRTQPLAPPAQAAIERSTVGRGANLERTNLSSRRRVLMTALYDHMAATEMLLVELKNMSGDDSEQWEFERAAADDLISSGRLYRATAEQTGDTQFAQLLDDLEGVLVEFARSPKASDEDAVNLVRTRIDDDDLLFKVRAVTAEVRDRQRTLMTQQ